MRVSIAGRILNIEPHTIVRGDPSLDVHVDTGLQDRGFAGVAIDADPH